ncbi:NAD(P)/FAD-dependent oxidoreductase [Gordonia rhizosphera]|uniref:Putative ferredoxin reductase n=1 Tax=Gordonia rhizosphera NBRC 16068 TaxID=1108045 RepID=K6VSQ0_9ACTN|nr:FAD/NAD(P)-binding oxidoreductase [Gordonia rhizosphera]GAB89920.1 putative ferredoxin reductase [Gordonia rhizosphera NBRC 16068]
MPTIVIIGAGLAGAKAAEAVRDHDFDGEVILLGAEEHLPYERPPLSKEFLAGKKSLHDFTVHDARWYLDNRIDLRMGTTAEKLDLAANSVQLADGTPVTYDKLLLATGSRARHLDIPGADAPGVHHLRTIDDARHITAAIADGTRLAVVGAGWIGLEVAAGARDRGAEVTIAEAASAPLLTALGAEVAEVFADLHRQHGVDLRTGVGVERVVTGDDGAAHGLELSGGDVIDADLVLIAAGAVPNLELADTAGLATGGGGVLVTAGLQSSDADVYAVGDIANAFHPLLQTRVRTEHWANALNQPAVAVTNMLGGDAEYTNLPYFFTDQYDLGMEYAGLSAGYQQVVFRGDIAGRQFVAFWLDGDAHVLAGMQVNIWDQLEDIKSLISSGSAVDTARLGDPDIPLPQTIS